MGFLTNLRNNLTIAKHAHSTPQSPQRHIPQEPSDDRPLRDVLKPYSKFNFKDEMNDLFIIDQLREQHDESGAKRAYNSFTDQGVVFNDTSRMLGPYLSYVLAKSELEHTISHSEKHTPLSDSEQFASAVIIAKSSEQLKGGNNINKLSYETLSKFMDISHSRNVELLADEFAQLTRVTSVGDFQRSSTYNTLSRKMIAKYPIPDVKKIKNIYDTPDLSDLYDKYKKDKYFANNYNIDNIYAVANNKQSALAPKQGRHVITLNTGTSNESLIKILNGGFKRPSEIFRELQHLNPTSSIQKSGQMFGDAVYFANPNQISKNTAYVDRVNEGHKFIIVADIYYDKMNQINGDRGRNCQYDGHNLVCAKNVGRYNRDEYMVAPEQIQIKYVLEIKPGELQKPKPIKTKTSNVNLDLTDLSSKSQDSLQSTAI